MCGRCQRSRHGEPLVDAERGARACAGRGDPGDGNPSSDADVRFGHALRGALDDAGMTAAAMARALFVTERSVRRYTSADRRPDASIVDRWEGLCGLAPGSLMELYAALPVRRAVIEPWHAQSDAVPASTRRPSRGSTAGVARAVLSVAIAIGVGAAASGGFMTRGLGGEARHGSEPAARDVRRGSVHEMLGCAAALRRIVAPLGVARTRERARLSSASTAYGQASAARRLSIAYARATSAALRLRAPVGVRSTSSHIVDALRAARRGYAMLAFAARRRNARNFARASEHVRRAERRLRRVLLAADGCARPRRG